MTTQPLTDFERLLVDLAVADAPIFTEDQILELRRVLKPYVPPVTSANVVTPSRRSDGRTPRRAA